MADFEILDEFYGYDNEGSNDILSRFVERPYVNVEESGDYMLSYDKEEPLVLKEEGSTTCKFTTDSQRQFLHFCNFLSKHDFEKMELCDPHHYRVEVYKLTDDDADLLAEVFLRMGSFVPQQTSSQVA